MNKAFRVATITIFIFCMCAVFFIGWSFDKHLKEIDDRLDTIELELHNVELKKSVYLQSVSCLAHNIYYEANTEPLEGKIAVAQVTLNRLADPNRPKTVCDVVFEPGQFAWTHAHPAPINREAYLTSLHIAQRFLTMKERSAIIGKDVEFYHNVSIHPAWADQHEEVATIGQHVFYR
jgi:spore germination cell wall hydrolase CwlJ-like protein